MLHVDGSSVFDPDPSPLGMSFPIYSGQGHFLSQGVKEYNSFQIESITVGIKIKPRCLGLKAAKKYSDQD